MESLLEQYAQETGWDEYSKLSIVLEFLELCGAGKRKCELQHFDEFLEIRMNEEAILETD